MQEHIQEAARAVREASIAASSGLVDRQSLMDLIVLAAVAREHLLVIGPPGTAKSEVARRAARAIHGRYFEYLLGRFTEPSEIFGPVDLRKLREGTVETETRGMLPEAEVAFLDEIFLGSTAILNTLLGILNERTFRRGHTDVRVPLRLCVAASNALPDDETLAAFADRFLVRAFVDPIPDSMIEELLAGGWRLSATQSAVESPATIEHLDTLAQAARSMDLDGIRPHIGQAVRKLRRVGIDVSDRRVVKIQKLVAAAAVLGGRTTATTADLWPIIVAIPTRAEQALARETLSDFLAKSENEALSSAAEAASSGPLARAANIEEVAAKLFATPPSVDDAEHYEGWQLRIEGIGREIDAAFDSATMPTNMRSLRERIVAVLTVPMN